MGGRIPSPTNAERLPDQIQGYSGKVVVMVGMVGSVVLVVLVVGYDGFDTNYCLPGTRNGNQKAQRKLSQDMLTSFS